MSIATHVSPSLVGLHVPRRWSGRRGSNPRPTAWKAVTLPLSYSRESHSHPSHQTGPPPRPGVHSLLVARGGFEPPKPLGRQIYSLLRLTAPQPRRCFDRHTTANSCQMLAETEVARFMNPTAFGRRCIPHARRLASRSAGSNAAGMLLPRALPGRRLDALGASPYS